MRADRLLTMVLLLQTRGRMTGSELARELEVSERTIYRDLYALEVAGVPLHTSRGPGGGCALEEGYRTRLTGLTTEQVSTLFVSGAGVPLADLGLDEALEGVMLKLLASLPPDHREHAERARQRLHLDASPWFRSEESVPHLAQVQEAIWSDRVLVMEYVHASGKEAHYRTEPYGLVAKASTWYLVGNTVEGTQVFRVSRIRDVEETDQCFTRDAGFDLAVYWGRWSAEFEAGLPRYPVTLRVASESIPRLHQQLGEGLRETVAQAGPPDEHGYLALKLEFESLESAVGNVLALGTDVEVVEPPELRHRVATIAAGIATVYQPETR